MNIKRTAWFLVTLMICFASAESYAQIMPPDSTVLGKTIPEWVGENHRWEWGLSNQGLSFSEVRATPPHQLGTVQNDGPVYFTAGFFGPFDEPLVENLLIPPGRPVIQRLFDFSWDLSPQGLDGDGLPVGLTEQPEVAVGIPDGEKLLGEIETIVESSFAPFHFEWDGSVFTQEEIAAHRIDYQATVPIGENNEFGIPPGDWPQVGVGYWFMLEPFEQGEQHSIRLGSLTPDGTVFPDITLNFTAVPEPGAWGISIFALLGLTTLRHRRDRPI